MEVLLNNDIDFTGFDWDIIENYSSEFDGNGYTIKNLTDNNGIFNTIEDAKIYDLNISNFNPIIFW